MQCGKGDGSKKLDAKTSTFCKKSLKGIFILKQLTGIKEVVVMTNPTIHAHE